MGPAVDAAAAALIFGVLGVCQSGDGAVLAGGGRRRCPGGSRRLVDGGGERGGWGWRELAGTEIFHAGAGTPKPLLTPAVRSLLFDVASDVRTFPAPQLKLLIRVFVRPFFPYPLVCVVLVVHMLYT